MSYIELEGMEFFSYHGCFKEEQLIGTKFKIDLVIEVDTDEAAKYDDLNKTINYLTVYQLVKAQMSIKSKLLENVAKRILDELYTKFPTIKHAKIKVSKINPPLGGKLHAVSIIMDR